MKERELKIGTPDDNFQMVYCRGQETARILECLSDSPFVFLYSNAGNGKTTFGVEFRSRVPKTALILGSQLSPEGDMGCSLYDFNFSDAKILIVDEFDAPNIDGRDVIDNLLAMGKKFVFMVHYPKKRYLLWREQHQEYLQLIVDLVNDYPDTPWLHLTKYIERP